MPAYAIFIREKILDQGEMAQYGAKARDALTGFDAKPLAAYGAIESLEGAPAEGVVIVQFNSMDEARDWYNSDTYQGARRHRLLGASYRAMLVDGL